MAAPTTLTVSYGSSSTQTLPIPSRYDNGIADLHSAIPNRKNHSSVRKKMPRVRVVEIENQANIVAELQAALDEEINK